MSCNWVILGPGFIATVAVIPAIQRVPGAHALAVASSSKEVLKRFPPNLALNEPTTATRHF